MSRVLVGLPAVCAGGLVVALASRVQLRPQRVAALRPGPSGPGSRAGSDPLRRLGRLVRDRLGHPPDPGLEGRAGLAVVVGVVALAFIPPVGLAWTVGVLTASVLRRRRQVRREVDALVDELPELVDLLWLATAAGLTVPLAIGVVERHGQGQVADAFARVRRRTELGPALADALDELPHQLGEPVRPVSRLLSGSLREGTSLALPLERVAAEVRVARRRAAEERARRVSVRLLFPLVVCILPAFAVLTVVPLLAGALSGLAL